MDKLKRIIMESDNIVFLEVRVYLLRVRFPISEVQTVYIAKRIKILSSGSYVKLQLFY